MTTFTRNHILKHTLTALQGTSAAWPPRRPAAMDTQVHSSPRGQSQQQTGDDVAACCRELVKSPQSPLQWNGQAALQTERGGSLYSARRRITSARRWSGAGAVFILCRHLCLQKRGRRHTRALAWTQLQCSQAGCNPGGARGHRMLPAHPSVCFDF